jgi:hypothetical protein
MGAERAATIARARRVGTAGKIVTAGFIFLLKYFLHPRGWIWLNAACQDEVACDVQFQDYSAAAAVNLYARPL